jgi:hypothetical protein
MWKATRSCFFPLPAIGLGGDALGRNTGNMNPFPTQAFTGHSSLEMVRRHVHMVDEDLMQAHQEHGPVDRWIK